MIRFFRRTFFARRGVNKWGNWVFMHDRRPFFRMRTGKRSEADIDCIQDTIGRKALQETALCRRPGHKKRKRRFWLRIRKSSETKRFRAILLAAGEGFEPSHTESESAVLPLHNPARHVCHYTRFCGFVKGNGKIIFAGKTGRPFSAQNLCGLPPGAASGAFCDTLPESHCTGSPERHR